jgi:hypothetical protein
MNSQHIITVDNRAVVINAPEKAAKNKRKTTSCKLTLSDLGMVLVIALLILGVILN